MIRRKNRRFGLLAAVLLLAAAVPVNGEEETMEENWKGTGLTLLSSYKKEGENNPLYTQRFGADPGVMVYDGRVYVYMTDDIIEYGGGKKVKENTYSKIRCINCISSDDLVNWTDHGRIPVAGSWGIARWAINSWAPCAAHKEIDGKEKFFLYFCNGGNGIGVITADSPAGPWKDEVGKLLIDRSVPNCADVLWLFDPAVMVDEDGTGYLAFGGGVPDGKQAYPGTGRIVKLGEDMISLDGEPQVIDAPFLFEDSGLNRIDGKYVYSYCSNWQTKGNAFYMGDGAIQYMTSDHPMGPYEYAGELFPNEGKFFGLYGNNHHSIAELDGSLYLFYHSRPVEQAMGITGNYRSPQVDRITKAGDGSLSVIGTMEGIPQLKAFDPYQEVLASTMSDQAGISVEVEEDLPVVKTAGGSWLKVSGVDFGGKAAGLTVKASSEDGCRVYAVTGSLEGEILAVIEIPAGTEEAEEFTAEFLAAGQQDLYFVFDGEADFLSWSASRE